MEKVAAIVDGREYVALEEDRPYSYDELGYLVYSGFNPDEGLGIRIDNDYNNFPIVNVPSWVGEKTVRIRLVDAGVWLRNFYVGDGEEYSIAWNSDLEGFITTLGFIKIMVVKELVCGRSVKRIREYLLICHHQTIDVIFNINFSLMLKGEIQLSEEKGVTITLREIYDTLNSG